MSAGHRGTGQVDAALIEALYGPALHDGDWQPALFRVSDLLGCAEVAVSTTAPGAIDMFETTGRLLSEEARQRYEQHYGNLDPKIRLLARRREGFLFNDSAYFDEVFVGRDPFYQEFSRWVGTRHTLDIAIGSDRLRTVYFAAMRTEGQGRFQSDAEVDFADAARHFGRVHALRARLDAARSSLELAQGALDTLSFGLIVLDADGVARLVNTAAEAALQVDRALQLRRGRLAAKAADVDRALQALVGRALAGGPVEASAVRVPREAGSDWTVWVARLPESSPLAPRAAPGVLVLIGHAGVLGRIDREDMMTLYELTAAEADLALALTAGRTLQQAAEDRGVRVSTARTQLLAVLAKTGVHRQAELTRLIAGLPGAVLGRR